MVEVGTYIDISLRILYNTNKEGDYKWMERQFHENTGKRPRVFIIEGKGGRQYEDYSEVFIDAHMRNDSLRFVFTTGIGRLYIEG